MNLGFPKLFVNVSHKDKPITKRFEIFDWQKEKEGEEI